MGHLDGRIAAITGAGRGIGRETALYMAREGARVLVNDLGTDSDGTGSGAVAEEVVAEIRAGGGEAVAHTEDIATVAGGESLLESALDAFGGLDVLVNNAGILRDGTIFELEEDDWDTVIRVHLKGHYCCTRPFARYIREHNRLGCRIVNFSSVSGLFGTVGQSSDGAAKAGVAGFSRVLALELANYGCTVNTISPAALTRMTIPPRERRGETVGDQALLDEGPQHIAPVVAWLASEAAQQVTGEVLQVERGVVGIMQQPAVVRSFRSQGVWSLDALGHYIPKLTRARAGHEAKTRDAGAPEAADAGWGMEQG